MNIAVVGLWHLGMVTAACLASVGYEVVGIDENPETIAGLQVGQLPVFEPGVQALVRQGMESGHLSFSTDLTTVSRAEIVWIAFDTPVDEDDRADVAFVVKRISMLFSHLREDALVLISSQLPVGTTRELEAAYRRLRPNGTTTFAYSPENLRLGKAIEVFTRPDRVVVGIRNEADKRRIGTLFKPFTERIEWMSIESAEMTKHALNAFLATSVAFANELAEICERVGADAGEVERGLKTDSRIGPRAYLRPGSAFAGGTLGRDLSFLIERGHREQLPVHVFNGVQHSNETHAQWPRRRLLDLFGSVAHRTIAVLGLTYKPGTDTLRRSSAVETCAWLVEQGARVAAFDPAVKALPAELRAVIDLRASLEAAVRGAQALLVATEWPEFSKLTADDIVAWMQTPLVLDPGRFLTAQVGADRRIRYLTVGKPA